MWRGPAKRLPAFAADHISKSAWAAEREISGVDAVPDLIIPESDKRRHEDTTAIENAIRPASKAAAPSGPITAEDFGLHFFALCANGTVCPTPLTRRFEKFSVAREVTV